MKGSNIRKKSVLSMPWSPLCRRVRRRCGVHVGFSGRHFLQNAFGRLALWGRLKSTCFAQSGAQFVSWCPLANPVLWEVSVCSEQSVRTSASATDFSQLPLAVSADLFMFP